MIRNVKFSPDGEHFAYIRPVNGRGHLVIQQISGAGRPAVIPPGENTEFQWLDWANDSRVVFSLAASSQRGITETTETRLWAVNEDGSELVHIILPTKVARTGSSLGRALPPAQMQDDVIHWLPDEPNHILVALDGDQDGNYEVRKVDIRDGDFDVVRKGSPGIQSWMTDNNGDLRLGWGYRRSTFRMLVKNHEGMWQSADKATWYDSGYVPIAFSDDSDVAYMSGPDENGYTVVRDMNLLTGEFGSQLFSVDGYDIDNVALHPATRRPVGYQYTMDELEVRYFDPALERLQNSLDNVLPDTTNTIVSMTADSQKVMIFSASDRDPGVYSYLDRESGNLSMVAEILPGLPAHLMASVQPVSYEARDGVVIPAYITLPSGQDAKDLPFIVLPHGGPSSRDAQEFWYLSQYLASRGYAVFQPNFRGSSGYGNRFENAGRREWGGKMQEDVTDGALWLVEQGMARPDGMCIVGWSYGGYSAAMGAIQTPELYQCAASINGIMNLPRLIADDHQYIGGQVWTRHMGLNDESAKAVSPYHRAEEIQIPILIVQAEDDSRVHEDQGKRMARQLERLKKDVEYISIEFGGHSLGNEDARLTMLTSLQTFLEKNLPPN